MPTKLFDHAYSQDRNYALQRHIRKLSTTTRVLQRHPQDSTEDSIIVQSMIIPEQIQATRDTHDRQMSPPPGKQLFYDTLFHDAAILLKSLFTHIVTSQRRTSRNITRSRSCSMFIPNIKWSNLIAVLNISSNEFPPLGSTLALVPDIIRWYCQPYPSNPTPYHHNPWFRTTR